VNLHHEWTVEGHLFYHLRSKGRFAQKYLRIDFETLANDLKPFGFTVLRK
jgi:hypothetical protein